MSATIITAYDSSNNFIAFGNFDARSIKTALARHGDVINHTVCLFIRIILLVVGLEGIFQELIHVKVSIAINDDQLSQTIKHSEV